MKKETTNLVKQLAFECSQSFQLFNLTKAESLIFSYLYIQEKPYTVDTLSNELGQSKTSIHTSIRSLTNLNLVHRVWIKGSRKYFYQAYTDLNKHMQQVIQKNWIELFDQQLNGLSVYLKDISFDEQHERSSKLQEKLKKLIEFHRLIKSSSESFINRKPSHD